MFYIVYMAVYRDYRKAKQMKQLVVELRAWAKKQGNSYARAAVLLGYKDSAPIRQWVNRNSIPSYQTERVKQMIKGELK